MPEETVSAADLVRAIQTPTARGIAADVTAMVQRGELLAGTRLPTVRAVAAELAVSPATVVNAWSLLQRRRVIATFGRRGAFVSGLPAVSRPTRFDRVGNFGRRLTVDLTELAPDPALLPDLRPAFAAALDDGISTGYGDDPITPRLRDAVAANWPFAAQEWSAVNGGYEALHLLAQTTIGPGDAVAVEEPTAARLLDIIESLGGQALPVICDQAGPLPASLASALSRTPVAFIFQPRGQSPAGHYLTPERCAQLAAMLQRSSAIVIEDDGAPELSCVPAVSIGSHLPERTVLVRSFSKSHGPDLRLAVVGGGGEIVSRLVTLRTYGARWTSRILQDAAAFLLTDETSRQVVALARDTYATRRAALATALADRGIRTGNRDGLALWVPVEDERHALVTCAAHGIATSPGSSTARAAVPGSGFQDSWKWCDKCQGLFYGPFQPNSWCPADGRHDGSESYDYDMYYNSGGGLQFGWSWCDKCQGLFYGPFQSSSWCPAGGRHDRSEILNYGVSIPEPIYLQGTRQSPV